MSESLRELNRKRKAQYRKNAQEENFFLEMNKVLREAELPLYHDRKIHHPLIFVFGPPRSGTTVLTQLIAASLDVGYITNLAARFWLAPLHGIRLSRSVLGTQRRISFESDYARTANPGDIHEFGYFWRHLLRKESLEDVVQCAEREDEIDWVAINRTLATLSHEVDSAMVFKNIFGAYHLDRFRTVLEKVVYIYVERDPLDTAVSILDARRKHYSDLNTWWSYAPIEYERLKSLDYWSQIAGQVFYLQRYYREKLQNSHTECSVIVDYAQLCREPEFVLKQIRRIASSQYGFDIEIVANPPKKLPYRTYDDRSDEKKRFNELMYALEKVDS